MTCSFETAEGRKCGRPLMQQSVNRCIFHNQANLAAFTPAFEELVTKQDGQWAGFVFPKGFKLEKKSFAFPISATDCTFGSLELREVEFLADANFSGSSFHSINFVGVRFQKLARFQNITCEGQASFGSVRFFEYANLSGARFRSDFLISGNFYKDAHFNTAIFEGPATFRGQRNVTIVIGGGKNPPPEMLYLFGSETHFQSVRLGKPESVSFVQVDLSNTRLSHTYLKGVTFTDVNWWQPRLRRNGLFEDVWSQFGPDKEYRRTFLPQLEQLYRHVRVALEDNKDYPAANDFYIGEMEAARKQKPFLQRALFSLPAIYRILSGYGTRPGRALLVFVLLICAHAILTASLVPADTSYRTAFSFPTTDNCIVVSIESAIAYLTHSLRTATLLRAGPTIEPAGWALVADSILNVLGPIQLALSVIALRARLKRH